MKTYTVRPGVLEPGIRLAQDGMIHLGQEGRGRQLTRVPVPPGSTLTRGGLGLSTTLDSAPGDGAVVLVRDQSGFRGGWTLWPEGQGRVLAQGMCAQGDAGRMGGGPEYLLHLVPGQMARIIRMGRLYGSPSILEVRCNAAGEVTLHDLEAEARTTVAAEAWA